MPRGNSVKERRAAIDADAVLKRSLNDMSAADFVQVLGKREFVSLAPIIADKKKVELWVDEGPIFDVPLEDLLEKIRGEKKKLELEVPDFYGPVVNPAGNRQLDYSRLVEDVAALVEQRISKR